MQTFLYISAQIYILPELIYRLTAELRYFLETKAGIKPLSIKLRVQCYSVANLLLLDSVAFPLATKFLACPFYLCAIFHFRGETNTLSFAQRMFSVY